MSKKIDMTDLNQLYDVVGGDLSRDYFYYDLFSGHLDEVGGEIYQNTEGGYREKRKAVMDKLKDMEFDHIESEPGGEGEGEYCYGVVRLGEKYYKAEWTYYSYNGCEYDYIEDTIKEVTPVQKTITVYE